MPGDSPALGAASLVLPWLLAASSQSLPDPRGWGCAGAGTINIGIRMFFFFFKKHLLHICGSLSYLERKMIKLKYILTSRSQ